MGKGIRELAMSPDEPEKEQESLFKPYPSQYGPRSYDSDRYDGNYDSREYEKNQKEMEKEDEELAKQITINLKVTRKEMGPKYDMDAENYEYDTEAEENTAKEMAYDKITVLLGTGWESKYVIVEFTVDYGYEEFDATMIIKPTEYLKT